MNETLLYMANKTGFNAVCELNQAKMLESTEKIAPTGYYILLIGLASLIFYFIIQPRLKQNVQDALQHYIGVLGMSLVFLSAWVLALAVFDLSAEALLKLNNIASFLFLPVLVLVIYILYRRFKV